MKKTNIRMLAEVALFATLAYILDVFTQPMQIGPWISFSFKMVPIFIVTFRWGTKAGMLSGFIWGLLQIVTGQAAGGFLNVFQGFLEYFVAFALIGVGGIVKPAIDKARSKKQNVRLLLTSMLGIIIGTLSRYVIHFIAGIIFWGSYAPKGQSAIYYSFYINGFSWLGETLACILVIWALSPFMYRLLNTKQS
ncbi:energy-coupled thiamine transporter ThiT [Streptococcus loxodontisalivarius]|uniref:Thiamine transporter n=1 Tax=Streptococcus loxodontisalivarius TaxID=1349415 RepID=A0ABS2PT02_9STRE|nr:energy-coupled thiamine transporter ThiT [Streptococcus loxodontisalivarius]MBM7643169.1 thiamine transporter [Streptococcus loxodontisalivarius]